MPNKPVQNCFCWNLELGSQCPLQTDDVEYFKVFCWHLISYRRCFGCYYCRLSHYVEHSFYHPLQSEYSATPIYWHDYLSVRLQVWLKWVHGWSIFQVVFAYLYYYSSSVYLTNYGGFQYAYNLWWIHKESEALLTDFFMETPKRSRTWERNP